MSYRLDLDDIQGNVVRAYGRYSFPFARYMFFNIREPAAGRKFVNQLLGHVTTAARWTNGNQKPSCTLNCGFTFLGLYMLELSQRVLQGMPEEFIAGMKDRAFLLGDRDQTKPEPELGDWAHHWDRIWRENRAFAMHEHKDVHIWVSLNAQRKRTPGYATDDLSDPALKVIEPVPDLGQLTDRLRSYVSDSKGGVALLSTNGRNGADPWMDAQAVFRDFDGIKLPTAKEHFGFTDGVGDPVFAGQLPQEQERIRVRGRGKRMGTTTENDGWEPLAPGEFILGHPDEAQELPPSARPPEFTRNGTFMAYRKLHEMVDTFRRSVRAEAERYARVQGIDQAEAEVTLRAKMCGRWPDGIPLAHAPTHAEWQAKRQVEGFEDPSALKAFLAEIAYLDKPESSDFRFADDMKGYRTPPGAHMRRVNTRDYLDPMNAPEGDNPNATTALNKRRRIMRRGLPYGTLPAEEQTDETEQGVLMMVLCASLFRQFEFIQQQWIEYGLDFHQGNDTCPLLGRHDTHRRMAIPADPGKSGKGGACPYTISGLDTVVECRGGDYFFIPSITALRALAMGVVDPT
ncbi:Dyp-type peroxidase [Sagittula salina]|uniref:Peroxidase n=1 Tax=Sagittula salina TaxID=2820268 RepID=A0A940MRJ6_9RHOB|nr:peroxidase [Sagittula salina]MBP0482742.1 peroxidase [Sagittula salina]